MISSQLHCFLVEIEYRWELNCTDYTNECILFLAALYLPVDIMSSFPCVSEVPPLEFHWRPRSPGCGPYNTCQNLIILSKPFKNLVKMNDSTVRHCATPSPARSGSWCPRWIPRGPPSKTQACERDLISVTAISGKS